MDSAQTAVPRINAAQILGGEHTVVSTAVYLRNFAKVLTKIGGSAYLHFYFTLRILLTLSCRWVDISTWTPPPQDCLYLGPSPSVLDNSFFAKY